MKSNFKFLVIVGAILMTMIVFRSNIAEIMRSADNTLLASLITACATVLVGLASVLIAHDRAKQREIEEVHRKFKIEIYKKFNDFLFRMFESINDPKKKVSDEELKKFMIGFKKDMIFMSSPDLIKVFNQYEDNAVHKKYSIFIDLDNILKTMRKEVGISNRGLENFELIRVFTKDDDALKKIKDDKLGR